HRCFRPDLRFRRCSTTERESRQFTNAETMSAPRKSIGGEMDWWSNGVSAGQQKKRRLLTLPPERGRSPPAARRSERSAVGPRPQQCCTTRSWRAGSEQLVRAKVLRTRSVRAPDDELCRIPEPFHQQCCCVPGLRRAEVASATQAGRSAVRRWRIQGAPRKKFASQNSF